MTKFFVPENSPERGEHLYEWIVRYVKAMLDCEIEPFRIYSLAYSFKGQQYRATVGEIDPRTGQLVIAILRSASYLICTPYYGVRRGEPIPIELSDVGEVQYFEGLGNARQKLKLAVTILDNDSDEVKANLCSAAASIRSLTLEDFPSTVAGDVLSLQHKLAWRGTQDATIDEMSESEVQDAAAAIRALYVDTLVLANQ